VHVELAENWAVIEQCTHLKDKKPSYRWDSQPYCITADYLVISDYSK